MNRDDGMVFLRAILIALFVVFAFAALADEPKLPAGYSCEDVRVKVAELGRAGALALAVASGATWAQIREAKKCLRQ